MKKIFALAIALMVISVPAFAGVVNGDWATGDETGWTRIGSSWGGGMSWAVTSNGPTAPEGLLQCDSGSFGWYQIITDCPVGVECTVEADWTGNSIDWIEIMFWSVAAGTPVATIEGTFDSGPASAIAYKKDAWGVNPPTTFDWEAASLSPLAGGNGGTVVNNGWLVVGLKLGKGGGGAAAAYDNITVTCVPEPASLLAMFAGLGGLILRRKH